MLMAVSAIGVYIILANLEDNIVFFYPPSEIAKIDRNSTKVRVGGMVKEGSVHKLSDSKISFIITDFKAELTIEYDGILPALFREKQGIVAEGNLDQDNFFIAKSLLAKHDENYMPPNLEK